MLPCPVNPCAPQRILVLGCGSSGKSTFSCRLAKIMNLPLIHLDAAYWRPKWTKPSPKEWEEQVWAMVRQPRWIIDGSYFGTLPLRLKSADVVILFDLPTRVCLWRTAMRWLRFVFLRVRRPGLADGCDELLNLAYLRWICDYRRIHLPKVTGTIKNLRPDLNIQWLRGNGDMEKFLTSKAYQGTRFKD